MIISIASDKLGSTVQKIVLEEDGTEIDDDYLPFVQAGTVLTLGGNEQ